MTAATVTLNTGTGGAAVLTDTLTTVDGAGAPTSAVAQLVKVGSGAAGTFNTASTTNPLPSQIASLYYPASTANSSTSQLAAAASFTGTIESVQALQAMQISVVCDQAYTVQIQQFIDSGGTKALPVITFTRTASSALNENVTLAGDYVRVVVTNNGASTTTTLTISTTYGMMDTLPYALTNLGNAKTSLNEVSGTALALGQAAMAASLPVTIANNQATFPVTAAGAAASGAAISGNPVLIGGTFTTTLPTVTTGQAVNVQTTARGEQLVAISSGATAVAVKAASTAAATTDPALVVSMAGANSAVKVGDGTNNAAIKAASTAAATTDPALVVSLSPNSPITLPTPSTFLLSSAATTNATSIKATAGTVYSVTANNTGAAAAFVKLYNTATAPTVGTTVPTLTLSVPAGGSINIPFGTTGVRFATGIACAITNLGTDADATVVVAAQIKLIVAYI